MLFSAGLASILLLAGATYAEVAHVILPDLTKSQVSPRAVSPSDARLVFAQRLGLEEFHSLQNANEATIESLNLLGAKPEPLFSGKSLAEPQQSAIIVVEGADDIFGQFSSQSRTCSSLTSFRLRGYYQIHDL